MCNYCAGYFGQTTEFSCMRVDTDVEYERTRAYIEKRNEKAEIVLNGKSGLYWIKINKCPMCGADLN